MDRRAFGPPRTHKQIHRVAVFDGEIDPPREKQLEKETPANATDGNETPPPPHLAGSTILGAPRQYPNPSPLPSACHFDEWIRLTVN